MKASVLFDILSKMTPEEREKTRIVLAHDAEENEFSPLCEAYREHGANVPLSHVTNTLRQIVASGPVLVLRPQ